MPNELSGEEAHRAPLGKAIDHDQQVGIRSAQPAIEWFADDLSWMGHLNHFYKGGIGGANKTFVVCEYDAIGDLTNGLKQFGVFTGMGCLRLDTDHKDGIGLLPQIGDQYPSGCIMLLKAQARLGGATRASHLLHDA